MGCYLAQPSPVPPDTQSELPPSPTSENDICIVSSNSNNSISVVCSPCRYDMWTLYFDGSKTGGLWRWLRFSRPTIEKTLDLRPLGI